MGMLNDINALERLEAFVTDSGGMQRHAAAKLGITPQYLCDLLNGRRTFSERILAKLGLRRAVVESRRPARAAQKETR